MKKHKYELIQIKDKPFEEVVVSEGENVESSLGVVEGFQEE